MNPACHWHQAYPARFRHLGVQAYRFVGECHGVGVYLCPNLPTILIRSYPCRVQTCPQRTPRTADFFPAVAPVRANSTMLPRYGRSSERRELLVAATDSKTRGQLLPKRIERRRNFPKAIPIVRARTERVWPSTKWLAD